MISKRHEYARVMYVKALGKHAKRSGWQSMMADEVVKSLRRLPRKRGKAA